MFRRRAFLLGAASALITAFAAVPQTAPERRKPRLVVAVAIDQFRYDYLTRFRADYAGGLDRLLRRGAVFTNARYEHFPTVTAVGHSTFLTGATPSLSGIVGNEWYDRATGKQVTSVGDDTTQLLGGKGGVGSSPRRLAVSTIGDELKIASRGECRVVGISLKDRAAILPAGHISDGAYWFDPATGNFVSSTFYFQDLPAWAKEFNGSRAPDRYASAEWKPLVENASFPSFAKKMPATPGPGLWADLESSPFGNDLIEAFAERAIQAEQLGHHAATDLLTVSFSSNDYVGHEAGPDAPEVRDMSIRVDRTLGKLLDFIDQRIGLANTIVVLTGDHGIPPLPEVLEKERMPGGRLSAKSILAAVQNALAERYGEGRWVVGSSGPAPYINDELIRSKKLDAAEVHRVAAAAVMKLPHIFRVYTREDVLTGQMIQDNVSQRVTNGFFPSRSSDLFVIEEPYWIQAQHGTTHGSPFMYDAHVPVVFMGPGVKAGRYHRNIMPNDIAPTLATMLDVETPSGSIGRVLDEMLAW